MNRLKGQESTNMVSENEFISHKIVSFHWWINETSLQSYNIIYPGPHKMSLLISCAMK